VRMNIGQQIESSIFFPQAGLQLVGVVEPASVHRGVIECTLRDYGILGGLIEANDATALQTLDVLLLGVNFFISPPIARAISQAVRGGMGLLNEYWAGTISGTCDDLSLRELMLADSPYYAYHMPGQCGGPMSATVLREHPLLPGLRAGMTMTVAGCGPAYRVMPSARVLIAKDEVVQPSQHRIAGLGPIPMPCYILGQLGRGRVAVNHTWPTKGPGVSHRAAYQISRQLAVSREEYFLNLLHWLAGSKAEQG
jgi:hypothetical protein